MRRLSSVGVLAAAGTVCAQSNPAYVIEVSNPVSPTSPTTTLSVYAAWDQPAPGDFVFGAGGYDLAADDGLFTGIEPILGLCNNNAGCGQIRGNRIDGMVTGQLHIPPLNIFGNPDNPIHLFNIEWTATNFTPRTVGVVTENTSHFNLVPGPGGKSINLASMLTPGAASIVVTPAPGVFVVVGAGAVFAVSRRRSCCNVVAGGETWTRVLCWGAWARGWFRSAQGGKWIRHI